MKEFSEYLIPNHSLGAVQNHQVTQQSTLRKTTLMKEYNPSFHEFSNLPLFFQAS